MLTDEIYTDTVKNQIFLVQLLLLLLSYCILIIFYMPFLQPVHLNFITVKCWFNVLILIEILYRHYSFMSIYMSPVFEYPLTVFTTF